MAEYVWIVTYSERLKNNKPVLDEESRPKIDSVTIGPFGPVDGESKARDYSDKNIKEQHKFFRCKERVRDKATKLIRTGQAEEL